MLIKGHFNLNATWLDYFACMDVCAYVSSLNPKEVMLAWSFISPLLSHVA